MSVCNSCWRSSTSRAWSATPHALGIRSTLLCLFRASPGTLTGSMHAHYPRTSETMPHTGRTPPRRGPPSARPPVVLASTAAGADTGPTRSTHMRILSSSYHTCNSAVKFVANRNGCTWHLPAGMHSGRWLWWPVHSNQARKSAMACWYQTFGRSITSCFTC